MVELIQLGGYTEEKSKFSGEQGSEGALVAVPNDCVRYGVGTHISLHGAGRFVVRADVSQELFVPIRNRSEYASQ